MKLALCLKEKHKEARFHIDRSNMARNWKDLSFTFSFVNSGLKKKLNFYVSDYF